MTDKSVCEKIVATIKDLGYPSRMVSSGLAFVGVWVYAWASFFGQVPLYALGCAGYLRALVPSLSPTPVAMGLVTFFYIINLLGVKPAARIQGVLVLILIFALIYYAYCGTVVIDTAKFDRIMYYQWRKRYLAGKGIQIDE